MLLASPFFKKCKGEGAVRIADRKSLKAFYHRESIMAKSFTRRFSAPIPVLYEFWYYIDGDSNVNVCSADSYDAAWDGVARLADGREFILEFKKR